MVLTKDTDASRLALLVASLEKQGLQSDFQTMENLSSPMETLLLPYTCLVIGHMTIGEANRLREWQIEQPKLKLSYEALRQGKTVYALSSDFDIHPSNQGLMAATDELIQSLDRLGMKVVAKRQRAGASINKSVISLTDVCQLKQQTLQIPRDAVVTVSAKQYLDEHNIVMTRK